MPKLDITERDLNVLMELAISAEFDDEYLNVEKLEPNTYGGNGYEIELTETDIIFTFDDGYKFKYDKSPAVSDSISFMVNWIVNKIKQM